MSDTDELGQNPFTSRGFLLSAVLVGFIVVLALVLVASSFFSGDGEPSEAAAESQAPATPSDPAAPGEPDGGKSVCGLGEVEMEGTLTEAPENTEWELLGTIAVPSVDGAGPGRVGEDGFRDCFARTPTGALVAAANMVALQENDATKEKFMAQMLAEGPGREAALEESDEQSSADSSTADVNPQISGFRMVSYDGSEANVQIVLSAEGVDIAGGVNLVWDQGDWKFLLADDGGLISPPRELPDRTGVILWSGA